MARTTYSRRKNKTSLPSHHLLKKLQLLSLKRICYLMMEILMMISSKRNLYPKFQIKNLL